MNDAHRPGTDGFETAWRKRFRGFAEERDDDAGIAGWTTTGLDARVRRFLQVWEGPGERESWLDAGCGAGTYTRILGKRGATAVGVDYSLLAVLKAIERTDLAIPYVVADVQLLPFRSGSFDGAICFGVTQALRDSAAVIGQLASMVKPGGVVWIDALNRLCVVHAVDLIRRKLDGRPAHLRYETPGALTRQMAAAGLSNVRLYWMPILPGRWQRFQAWLESRLLRFIFRYVPLVGVLGCHAFIVRGEKPKDVFSPAMGKR